MADANLSTFFPAIIYALCGLALLLIYPLSKAKVEANVKELELSLIHI